MLQAVKEQTPRSIQKRRKSLERIGYFVIACKDVRKILENERSHEREFSMESACTS
jgi:hypothetical protein